MPGARMIFFCDDVFDDSSYLTQESILAEAPELLPLLGHLRAAGFEVELAIGEPELLAAVDEPAVQAVGFWSTERSLPRCIDAATRLRDMRSDLILVLAGPGIEPYAVELAAEIFDVVVLGEAEHTLAALLEALWRTRGVWPPEPSMHRGRHVLAGGCHGVAEAAPGGALDGACVSGLFTASFVREVPGLGPTRIRVGGVLVRDSTSGTVWRLDEPRVTRLRSRGMVVPTIMELGSAPLAQELDDMYAIPWDVIERRGARRLVLSTQRGCRWGRCRFCSVAERQVRAPSPARVADIVAEALARGVETISFADSVFVQRPRWSHELFTRLRERGLRADFRARTVANRTVWPFLEAMREVGFSALGYGVHSLDPARVEFMNKTLNGRSYVAQAGDTVERTAAAGITPVMSLSLADPTSTLHAIAKELHDTARLLDRVHRHTGGVPALWYALSVQPVAGTDLTARFAHSRRRVTAGSRVLKLPAAFLFSREVSAYLERIAQAGAGRAGRGLTSLPLYMRLAEDVADELDDCEAERVRFHARAGLEVMAGLMARLSSADHADDLDRTQVSDVPRHHGGEQGRATGDALCWPGRVSSVW